MGQWELWNNSQTFSVTLSCQPVCTYQSKRKAVYIEIKEDRSPDILICRITSADTYDVFERPYTWLHCSEDVYDDFRTYMIWFSDAKY